jgi:hypothetical protein
METVQPNPSTPHFSCQHATFFQKKHLLSYNALQEFAMMGQIINFNKTNFVQV